VPDKRIKPTSRIARDNHERLASNGFIELDGCSTAEEMKQNGNYS
jgi:hypothetical protein